jgi:hypothetical protein
MIVILHNQAIHRMMAPPHQLRIRTVLEGAIIGDLPGGPPSVS